MHTWFHVPSDQKILKGIYATSLTNVIVMVGTFRKVHSNTGKSIKTIQNLIYHMWNTMTESSILGLFFFKVAYNKFKVVEVHIKCEDCQIADTT